MTSSLGLKETSSVEHLVVRSLTPLLAAGLIAAFFLSREAAGQLTTQIFVVTLVALVAVDLVTMRVPNAAIYPAIGYALAATAIIDVSLLPDAVAGGAICLALMFLVALAGRGAMGMGDVKFACFTGCVLGVRGGLTGLAVGFAIGGAAALLLLLFQIKKRRDSVPMTPYLASGAIAYVLVAGSLLN